MKKNRLQSLFLFVLFLLSITYLVSCSDNDSDNDNDKNKPFVDNGYFGTKKVFTDGILESMTNYAVYDSINTLVNTKFEYNTDNLLLKITNKNSNDASDNYEVAFIYPEGTNASHLADSLTMVYKSAESSEDDNTFILKIGSNGFVSEGRTTNGNYNFTITYNSNNQIKRIDLADNVNKDESFFLMFSYKDNNNLSSAVINYASGNSDFIFASYVLPTDTTKMVENTKQFPTQLLFTGDSDIIDQLSNAAFAGLLGYPTKNLPTSILELDSQSTGEFHQKFDWSANSANKTTKLITKNSYDESFVLNCFWSN